MREITEHIVNPANDQIKIYAVDEPGAGGANHEYSIHLPKYSTSVSFQNGPIAEKGVNGVTQEVLLAIVADRLKSFETGAYACYENRMALVHIREAQRILGERTRARMARGVEGTMEK